MFSMRMIMRLGLALSFALLLLVAPGCPDSEELTIDNGILKVRARAVNTAGVRHEMASVRISQIRFEPTNPDADQGPNSTGAFNFPLDADLTGASSSAPGIAVAAGQYRVTGLVIINLALRDDNPTTPPPSCIEGIVNPGNDGVLGTADDFGDLPDLRFSVPFPTSMSYTNLGHPTFNVPSGGGTLNVTIDAGALIAAYEASFNCFASSGGVCPGNVISTNCTSFFDVNAFLTNSVGAWSFN
jgi:hypothetical protein